MNADDLVKALTWCGKPIPPERLAKAKKRADSPEVWAEVERRIAGYVPWGGPHGMRPLS